MPASFVTSDQYPAVRAALGLDIDEVILPDETIEQQIYIDAAESEIKRRDTQWADRTGVQAAALVNAAIYFVAARIAPSMADIIGEKLGANQEYSRKAVDWPNRAIQLRASGERELSAATTAGNSTAYRPTFFGSAKGYRGQ
jgi:hypothetical protein